MVVYAFELIYSISIIWNIVFQNLRKGRGRELTFAENLPCARHCARHFDIHYRVYCEY